MPLYKASGVQTGGALGTPSSGTLTNCTGLPLATGIANYTKGTSFPGSPASGDLCWRSDRLIEYVYDGTRWLSTQLFETQVGWQDAAGAATASRSPSARWANPWFGTYSLYVEKCSNVLYISGTGDWSLHLKSGYLGTTLATLTASTTTSAVATVNQVVNTDIFTADLIENSGTASVFGWSGFTYRLVG